MTVSPIAFQFAEQHGIFAVDTPAESGTGRCCTLFCRDNAHPVAITEVIRELNHPVDIEFMTEYEFQSALNAHYQSGMASNAENYADLDTPFESLLFLSGQPLSDDLLSQEAEAPVIRLLNHIFRKAIQQRASDIHIQAFASELKVRYRIDGVLYDLLTPPRHIAPLLLSRIKILAGLDIAEKRVPLDGRTTVRLAGRSIDLRVSTMPTKHGERAVLRLLDKQSTRLELDTLGIAPTDLEQMKQVLARPSGIVLVTGPTGSGKTTTLYSALNHLNNGSRNIMTIEDPVEYDLEGVGQTQVNTKADMSFARGLRSMLRQDPDVVMVGEIRDKETAETAIQASLTGHMVLSTLHTNSALGAVTRLSDLGVESYLIASSISALLAQRLVRRLCDACKTPAKIDDEVAARYGISQDARVFDPLGCSACDHVGFKGRVAIYEWVVVNDDLRKLIHKNAAESDLVAHARKRYKSLLRNGIDKVINGETALSELLRVSLDPDSEVF